jgi:hypothetical protein
MAAAFSFFLSENMLKIIVIIQKIRFLLEIMDKSEYDRPINRPGHSKSLQAAELCAHRLFETI